MAEYPDFKHGAYGEVNADGRSLTGKGETRHVFVYIGTAPVHLVEGGASNVNRPILINNMADAKRYLGYSDNWVDYTLCEAMHAHFEDKGVGPLVFINVLDPEKHKSTLAMGSVTLRPENGRVTIVGAERAILDTLTVKTSESAEKVMGKDYTASYDFVRKVINIEEKTMGALGDGELSITYDMIDPSLVEESDVIGMTDGYGLNKGVYAIKNVYNVTGHIPSFIVAPGFSSSPDVHKALYKNSQQISKHWNSYMFVDMPIVDDDGNPITLKNASDWKEANGYNRENENVYFPLAKGLDGNIYHLSVLNAANFQELLIQNSGIPYKTGSNTHCAIIEDLYFGESNDVKGRVYDDEIINRTLNCNGINSAAYVGGQWVIWGMFPGSYNQEELTTGNINDTCRMMLYYLTNDFQHRRSRNVDKPMTLADLQMMVAEEQSRVDALLGIGALTYGKVTLDASAQSKTDLYSGDFRILFDITNTPLAKSLTAVANLTEDGYQVYFAAADAA